MTRRGSQLANRFKAALDHEAEVRRAEEQERLARLEAGRTARQELLADLVAFAESLGHLGITRQQDGGFAVTYEDRTLTVVPMGDGDRIKVDYPRAASTGRQVRLFRVSELGDRWVVSVRRGSKEDLKPLFDAGLEWLMVDALHLPRLSEEQAAAAAERPSHTEAASDAGKAAAHHGRDEGGRTL